MNTCKSRAGCERLGTLSPLSVPGFASFRLINSNSKILGLSTKDGWAGQSSSVFFLMLGTSPKRKQSKAHRAKLRNLFYSTKSSWLHRCIRPLLFVKTSSVWALGLIWRQASGVSNSSMWSHNWRRCCDGVKIQLLKKEQLHSLRCCFFSFTFSVS